MIINIDINIKKIIGTKDAVLLGNFASEPSENFNSISLKIDSDLKKSAD